MAEIETKSPEANYLTRPNIVHPESNHTPPGPLATQGETKVVAAEAKGRQDTADATKVTVSGGSIRRGK